MSEVLVVDDLSLGGVGIAGLGVTLVLAASGWAHRGEDGVAACCGCWSCRSGIGCFGR